MEEALLKRVMPHSIEAETDGGGRRVNVAAPKLLKGERYGGSLT